MARGRRGQANITLRRTYHRIMCRFMGFKDNTEYGDEKVFSVEEKLAIRPEHIVAWMNLLAYGTAEPGPEDNPTHCRSSNLEQHKKGISFFHPHKFSPWNIETEYGNPTRSVAVNEVIRTVKLAEVRHIGVPSQAKRDLKKEEYAFTVAILQSRSDHYKRRIVPTMMAWQTHLVGRIDDLSNLETRDLRSHPRFPTFALQTEVSWSKNVMEERQCPPQICLASNDTNFCTHATMAGMLESNLTHNQQSKFLFGSANRNDDREPGRINEKYSRTLRSIWRSNHDMINLLRLTTGQVGTHSLRKFPATYATERGCTQYEVEIRGRWKAKRNGSVVHRYINPEQLPIDAKVAGVLCMGGAIMYKVKLDSNVTNEFILTHVVPSIANLYSTDPSNQVALVLGPALLWVCHQPGLEHMVSTTVWHRIRNAYNQIRGEHPEEYNPVEKVPLSIYRLDNEIMIEPMEGVGGGDSNGGGNGGGNGGVGQGLAHVQGQNREALNAILLQIHRLDRRSVEYHTQVDVSTFCLFY